jgi:hypothetical protein
MAIDRFPDKPHRISQDQLDVLDNGQYIATFKKDGWRLILLTTAEGEHQAWSRHGKRMDTHSKFDQGILEAFKAFDTPPLTQIDTEWEAMRQGNKEGVSRCAVFGILRWEKKWLARIPEEERWARTLELPVDGKFLYIPEHTEEGFRAFFEDSKASYDNEGIVLKHKRSRLVLSRKGSQKNQTWLKIKWRDGADGQTLTDF